MGGHAGSPIVDSGETWKSSRTPVSTPATKSPQRYSGTPNHLPWKILALSVAFYPSNHDSGSRLCSRQYHQLGDATISRSAPVPTQTGITADDLSNTTSELRYNHCIRA
ncbi:hypothetical protein NW761_000869 [Fusarium oxysporum]|nr:hypothetical protein NW758_002983 [Fusarium oxysporum]KAJ4056448.1 hypothetical protein NW763_007203 [Fusarium oxysporum]KAJ4064782.1 hypothetical protein NW753_003235 [Fusarium oxysporum]KAJ4095261.1 hypothetical protein NW756_004075 [Fusarium oxysporum]KAJ4106990.1 hypothetical protein NW761_000869 [Fusarium oxysporum]